MMIGRLMKKVMASVSLGYISLAWRGRKVVSIPKRTKHAIA